MIPIAKPLLGDEEINAVAAVLQSGMIAEGERVREFENKFAEYIGVEHAVAVNSGTSALHAALLAHNIGNGDEVITTSFSFIATANSILFTGTRYYLPEQNLCLPILNMIHSILTRTTSWKRSLRKPGA
jgi:dTDP-4-amino-4,6-dideoxygalactose transaminase